MYLLYTICIYFLFITLSLWILSYKVYILIELLYFIWSLKKIFALELWCIIAYLILYILIDYLNLIFLIKNSLKFLMLDYLKYILFLSNAKWCRCTLSYVPYKVLMLLLNSIDKISSTNLNFILLPIYLWFEYMSIDTILDFIKALKC